MTSKKVIAETDTTIPAYQSQAIAVGKKRHVGRWVKNNEGSTATVNRASSGNATHYDYKKA
ncbi:hypothetical protein EQG49_05405 [Periweissella cryptocerci]|uniref:Uncharacterized protein n=2 Tax=Periweissella cryptocerci TaxID=2506420 RepID=A0A4P6YT68_9LACO|nr:hypothetical protein EQG49_05405 [Periweissella cryptocerci]